MDMQYLNKENNENKTIPILIKYYKLRFRCGLYDSFLYVPLKPQSKSLSHYSKIQ